MNIPGSTTIPELNQESRIDKKDFPRNAATTLQTRRRNQSLTNPRGTTFSLKNRAMTPSHVTGSSSRTSQRLALSRSLTPCWWQKNRKVNASQTTLISWRALRTNTSHSRGSAAQIRGLSMSSNRIAQITSLRCSWIKRASRSTLLNHTSHRSIGVGRSWTRRSHMSEAWTRASLESSAMIVGRWPLQNCWMSCNKREWGTTRRYLWPRISRPKKCWWMIAT
jgi:hypothetical protein